MDFRTELQPVRTDLRIDYDTRILMLGSCFSDNIGRKLRDRMFNVVVNPLGTVYNPASIAATASLISSGRTIDSGELFCHEGLWRHFMCHSSLAMPGLDASCRAINNSLSHVRDTISRHKTVAILTMGTARVFEHDGKIVSNCHKLPAREFERRLMSVDECAAHIRSAIDSLRSLSGDMRTILTVSPIRHMEAGLDGNSLSKATLKLACQAIVDEDPVNTVYFPAFEAVVDDLRDYRFYEADMRHPSPVAVDYIYDLFERSVMDRPVKELAREALSLSRRLSHRPMSGCSGTVERFESETRKLLDDFLLRHPEINIPVMEK